MYRNEALFYVKESWDPKVLIKIEELFHIYKNEYFETVALNDFNLEVNSGEFIAIMGPSGSGKTTLIKIISGIIAATSGAIYVNLGDSEIVDIVNLSIDEKRQFRLNYLGYISQYFDLFEELSAWNSVLLPSLIKLKELKKIRYLIDDPEQNLDNKFLLAKFALDFYQKYENEEDLETKAEELMKELGIYKRKDHLIKEMSGGERQRVAIAAAVLKEPKIILADEPTGELDARNSQKIFELFHSISKKEGKIIICVTHDPTIKKYADRVVLIEDGKNIC